jgi:hypothetical protein
VTVTVTTAASLHAVDEMMLVCTCAPLTSHIHISVAAGAIYCFDRSGSSLGLCFRFR